MSDALFEEIRVYQIFSVGSWCSLFFIETAGIVFKSIKTCLFSWFNLTLLDHSTLRNGELSFSKNTRDLNPIWCRLHLCSQMCVCWDQQTDRSKGAIRSKFKIFVGDSLVLRASKFNFMLKSHFGELERDKSKQVFWSSAGKLFHDWKTVRVFLSLPTSDIKTAGIVYFRQKIIASIFCIQHAGRSSLLFDVHTEGCFVFGYFPCSLTSYSFCFRIYSFPALWWKNLFLFFSNFGSNTEQSTDRRWQG